jgi:adenosine deaminase
MTYVRRGAAYRQALLLFLAVSATMSLSLMPRQQAFAETNQAVAVAPHATESMVSSYLKHIRDNPAAMDRFFQELPKGADLHNHLSGAATTELLIHLAAQDGMCINRTDFTVVSPVALQNGFTGCELGLCPMVSWLGGTR